MSRCPDLIRLSSDSAPSSSPACATSLWRRIPVASDGDWRDAPAIKARLAGGYCLRAPAQGACPYANICEHCPSFRTDAASRAVLATQRVDAEALAADAEARGWGDEADRHRRLVARLDALIAEADTA